MKCSVLMLMLVHFSKMNQHQHLIPRPAGSIVFRRQMDPAGRGRGDRFQHSYCEQVACEEQIPTFLL